MFRATLASLAGTVAGALLAGGVLRVAVLVVRATIEPPLAVEHGTIYLAVILGAGFGSIAGALVGLAGVLSHARTAEPLSHRHAPPPA